MAQSAAIIAAVLFILALGSLSNPEKAKAGIWYGMVGMATAVGFTFVQTDYGGLSWLVPLMVLGALIGTIIARRVAMTAMPQLVAALHSFVGLAAVFVGFNAEITSHLGFLSTAERAVLNGEVVLGIFVGAITFTGSVVAFAKLAALIDARPLMSPWRHGVNIAAVGVCLALAGVYFTTGGLLPLIVIALVAGLIGWLLVAGVGGGDMPVVVSMLNSYSGWAASAIGFTLGNDLLIITGALVGSSGAILSYIMCRAVNRNFVSVILGGMGQTVTLNADAGHGTQQPITPEECAQTLASASQILIVPGYGMAVAKAQNAVSELTSRLRGQGKTVRFAIHPVAGRLPGHMNVLLADAKVPYDIVFEMDEINHEFPQTDAAIVIGSNDIVNPLAQTDPHSPIAGMPVLEVWKAQQVVVLKRGQGTGYAGIPNPLFTNPNTRLLYGDAKQSLESVLKLLD